MQQFVLAAMGADYVRLVRQQRQNFVDVRVTFKNAFRTDCPAILFEEDIAMLDVTVDQALWLAGQDPALRQSGG